MTRMRSLIIVLASVAAMPACWSKAYAQNKGEVAIEGYRCRDLLRESGAERDIAIAFIHGYILGRNAAPKFDVEALRKQSAAFIERCLDNPQGRALDTMMQSAAGAQERPNAPRAP